MSMQELNVQELAQVNGGVRGNYVDPDGYTH
jgi:bacteriocin-like protein